MHVLALSITTLKYTSKLTNPILYNTLHLAVGTTNLQIEQNTKNDDSKIA